MEPIVLGEIDFKNLGRKAKELVKENNLQAYLIGNLHKTVSGFTDNGVICVNGDKNIYEIIFTTHHEIAHCVLGHTLRSKETEKEADNFACEMLFDDKEAIEKLKENYSFYDLEKEYGIPAKEILKRLKFVYKGTEIGKQLDYIYF